jgi:hypothetical protein
MDSYSFLVTFHFLLSFVAFASIDEMICSYIFLRQIQNKGKLTEYHIIKLKESKMGIIGLSAYIFSSLFLIFGGLYIYSFYSFLPILAHVSTCDILRRNYEK